MTESVLTQPQLRGLSDKVYEKRKLVALQIEQLTREYARTKKTNLVHSIIDDLTTRFVTNTQPNARKGGLIGLAAVAIGLSSTLVAPYLPALVPPVLRSFGDADARVRYYALESMYNVAKVGRGSIMEYLNELFDGLLKLTADSDQAVRSGAQLLDRLMKDIVAEAEIDDVAVSALIELMTTRLETENPWQRQALINWITMLDSVQIDLLDHLPALLPGLYAALADVNAEIRRLADGALAEFLREIEEADAEAAVDFEAMVPIIVEHTGSDCEFTQLTALLWASKFIIMGGSIIIPFVAPLLGNVLPCLSHEVEEITLAAIHVNQHLLALMSVTEEAFDFAPLIRTATSQLSNPWATTRTSALRWILMLHLKSPDSVAGEMDHLVEALLTALHDPSVKVVKLVLEVLSKLCSFKRSYFESFMFQLVSMFHSSPELVGERATLIVRQLAVFLDAEDIYVEFATILAPSPHLDFASSLVAKLNLILLTAPELVQLRAKLAAMGASPADASVDAAPSRSGIDLFVVLFNAWCHDPVAAFALCALSQAYETATELIQKFGELEVTVKLLVQVDKLIQLLESPVFARLRLQLLKPLVHPFLFHALYGLLMLLPQSSAYVALATRLQAASALTTSGAPAGAAALAPRAAQPQPDPLRASSSPSADLPALLAHFDTIQSAHTRLRRAQLAEAAMADGESEPDPTTDALPRIPVDPGSEQARDSIPSRPTKSRNILEPVKAPRFFAPLDSNSPAHRR
ncbi:HEAT repeat containing protein [Thecamonas trahens ATCC 50062]|uniref:HEAT repeat containing protein n=1 Tax=Thecamonas trahens ATCC 50062 TaxID=461836 RepID=A0A0L0DX68_THETB|nr:HEAT repeat containing protein [Thecamonas trahens ATCC 50062]KNC56118.1 HEAT repeat containing protein [Thecamonas trahens ATCC 50062]|eukprot:XP_013761160.1 HEAT repeat containing protein [Thecamonas trahens ATCC 50062]